MSEAVVDAKRGSLVAGGIDRVVRVGVGEGAVILWVDLSEANVFIAPPGAALALDCDLEVGCVNVRSRLEDRVVRIGVLGWAVVAAVYGC